MKNAQGEPWTPGEIGVFGERLAQRYLWLEGCKILRANHFAPKGGEVDIIAREANTLVFAEVKTRTSEKHGRPLEAVTREKEELIKRGAEYWLDQLSRHDVTYRYDIIEVVLEPEKKPLIRWVKNAF